MRLAATLLSCLGDNFDVNQPQCSSFICSFLFSIQFSMWPLLSGLLVKRERFDWPRPILAPQLTWKISPFNCKSLQRIKSFVSRTCEQNNSIGVKFIKFATSVRTQNNLQSGKSQLATFSKGLYKKTSWWMNLNRKSCLNTAQQLTRTELHSYTAQTSNPGNIIFYVFYNFVGLL